MNREDWYLYWTVFNPQKQIMKRRVISSEQEMTFPKAYEILHQSFPSKICSRITPEREMSRNSCHISLIPSVPSGFLVTFQRKQKKNKNNNPGLEAAPECQNCYQQHFNQPENPGELNVSRFSSKLDVPRERRGARRRRKLCCHAGKC